MNAAVHRDLSSEFTFLTSRSSGKGGQNVNKVETNVELVFSVLDSQLLSESEKTWLLEKWKSKLDSKGKLHIVCQESRSQLKNKEKAMEKFYIALVAALKRPKKRIPTKKSRAKKEAVLKVKKIRGEIKKLRKKP